MVRRNKLSIDERYDRMPAAHMSEPLEPKTRREIWAELAIGTLATAVLAGVVPPVAEHFSGDDTSVQGSEHSMPFID